MENGAAPNKTEIKYKVTSCYFCNEFIDNDTFKNHIEKCSSVLQKCPDGCVAYVTRKDITEHLRECTHKSGSNSLVEQDIHSIRSALQEESRQIHRIISDIGELRRQNSDIDQWIEKIELAYRNFKLALQDERNDRKSDVEDIHRTLEQLSYQYKEVKQWRHELRILLDRFHRDLEFRTDVTMNFESLFNDTAMISAKLSSLEKEFEQMGTKKPPKAILSSVNNPVPANQASCERCAVIEPRLAAIVDLRQMKNIVCETEDKFDKIEQISANVQKMCAQPKQELADFEEHLRLENKIKSFVNTDGHLLWRIGNYAAKFKNAQTNDVALKSPIFCNQPYGYSLRLDVLLDGFGTWKGRNILASLIVVPGEWDPLLAWPCKLKADIILRDQAPNIVTAKNITKSIMVRKRSDSYEYNQFIYISHKELKSRHFLVNDSIFFEVILHTNAEP